MTTKDNTNAPEQAVDQQQVLRDLVASIDHYFEE